MNQPRWLTLAWADLGVLEAPGSDNNPKVVRYYADAGHPGVRGDDVAWCAAFVGACLERAGVGGTRSLMARSYLSWGEALEEPRTGAVAVLSQEENRGRLALFAGIDDVRFKRIVRPGDELRLECVLETVRGPVGRGKARATVDGELAVRGTLTFAVGDPLR